MGFQIEDGSGSGVNVRVDTANRMKTTAVTQTDVQYATIQGDAYTLNSGLVTLVDASVQGVCYIKNNEKRDLHITRMVLSAGPALASGVPITDDTIHAIFYRNPTAGTLITEENAAGPKCNKNFGSSTQLDADFFAGDGSTTVTDGANHLQVLMKPDTVEHFVIDEVITQGDSIAITFEAPDTTTAMKCMAELTMFLEDPEA